VPKEILVLAQSIFVVKSGNTFLTSLDIVSASTAVLAGAVSFDQHVVYFGDCGSGHQPGGGDGDDGDEGELNFDLILELKIGWD
jgi:hypothetical protein